MIFVLLVFSLIVLTNFSLAQVFSNDDFNNFSKGLSDIKNQVSSEPVIFPSYLAVPFSFVFGIVQGSPLNLVVIHFGIWFLFFVFVFNMAGFVPYFKNLITKFFVSLIVTILISISGGFVLIVDSLQSINDLILKVTNIKSYTVGFIIVFVLVCAFLYVIVHLSKKFVIDSHLDKTEDSATSAGLRIGALQKLFRSENNSS